MSQLKHILQTSWTILLITVKAITAAGVSGNRMIEWDGVSWVGPWNRMRTSGRN